MRHSSASTLLIGSLVAGLLVATATGAASSATPATPAPPPPSLAEIQAKLLLTPPEIINGYAKLDFDRLGGFTLLVSPETPPTGKRLEEPPSVISQIPTLIKKYDGQKAILTGYMMPTATNQSGQVTEFMLLRSPIACCYGTTPAPNEWVVVKLTKAVPYVSDIPISCSGTFHVEEQRENGFLTGVYRLEGEKVTEPK